MIVSYRFGLSFGLGLKYCGNKKAGGEKPPALQSAGAEIFYEAPELCLKTLTSLNAALEIKFII